MDICAGLTSLDCAIEQNTLMTYKISVLVILLLYSIWVLYRHNDTDFMSLKANKSNYEYYKEFFTWFGAKFYIISLPLMLVLLRQTIDFELFLTFIAVGYTIFFVLLLGLSLLFTERFVFNFFSKGSMDNFRKRMKYAKQKN